MKPVSRATEYLVTAKVHLRLGLSAHGRPRGRPQGITIPPRGYRLRTGKTLVDGRIAWMAPRGYQSVGQMKGYMSQAKVADPSAFERASYVKVLECYRGPHPT